jgi:N-glycosylase/DNA lyase
LNDIIFNNDKIIIQNVSNFDLKQTFDCGQAFRWNETENGVWQGIVADKIIKLYHQESDIIIEGTNSQDFENFWRDYFDLSRDYSKVIEAINCDSTLKEAAAYGSGIRILKQDPWEALCSFIISQNNNIPRIKGIIDRLCENFGQKVGSFYTFPTADTLAKLTADDLAPIRSGFRAKYIIDAAKKVASGEIDLEYLKKCDIDTARDTLMTIKGVGPKVADCVLLFGLNKIDAFPKDVWIKKAMLTFFPDGLPECTKGYEGLVQQYIFFYARSKNI